MIPILFSYQNKMMDMYDSYRQKLLKQKRITSSLQIIMPGYLLEEASSSFSNTSYQIRVLELIQRVRDYRNKFIEYVKSKDGFGVKYFTQIPKDLWTDDFKTLWEDPVYDKYKSTENSPKLNLNDIPQFKIVNSFLIPYEVFFILLINLVILLLVTRAFIKLRIVRN